MSRKVRLDLHLLTQGLVDSRQQAQSLIRAGKVRDLFGKLLDKPGTEVCDDLQVQIQSPPRFVSRGGQKLLAALETFPVSVKGRVCLDVGISTGGFTDCLLQHGALKVYGIDVGYGQTAWNLRNDERVVLKERTNIRILTNDLLYNSQDTRASLAVADLSFISLRLVIPVITALLEPQEREALFLVKPQFEVGREKVGKGGVVRNIKFHIEAIEMIIESSLQNAWVVKGIIKSPITGAAGNQEYLLWLGLDKNTESIDIKEIMRNLFN